MIPVAKESTSEIITAPTILPVEDFQAGIFIPTSAVEPPNSPAVPAILDSRPDARTVKIVPPVSNSRESRSTEPPEPDPDLLCLGFIQNRPDPVRCPGFIHDDSSENPFDPTSDPTRNSSTKNNDDNTTLLSGGGFRLNYYNSDVGFFPPRNVLKNGNGSNLPQDGYFGSTLVTKSLPELTKKQLLSSSDSIYTSFWHGNTVISGLILRHGEDIIGVHISNPDIPIVFPWEVFSAEADIGLEDGAGYASEIKTAPYPGNACESSREISAEVGFNGKVTINSGLSHQEVPLTSVALNWQHLRSLRSSLRFLRSPLLVFGPIILFLTLCSIPPNGPTSDDQSATAFSVPRLASKHGELLFVPNADSIFVDENFLSVPLMIYGASTSCFYMPTDYDRDYGRKTTSAKFPRLSDGRLDLWTFNYGRLVFWTFNLCFCIQTAYDTGYDTKKASASFYGGHGEEKTSESFEHPNIDVFDFWSGNMDVFERVRKILFKFILETFTEHLISPFLDVCLKILHWRNKTGIIKWGFHGEGDSAMHLPSFDPRIVGIYLPTFDPGGISEHLHEG
jgi:hypothetical protein